MIAAVVQQTTLRVDILSSICTRLINYLSLQDTALEAQAIENIRHFIQLPYLPADLRLSFTQDLVRSNNPHLVAIAADPVIGALLLNGMN